MQALQKAPQLGEPLDNYIQRLRNDLKMSQQQVASRAGIHLQSIGKIERGQTHSCQSKD